MAYCAQCGFDIGKATTCPRCGYQSGASLPAGVVKKRWGFEWKSKTQILGWPLIHIAVGRSQETGRLLIAKGVIAIGQFAVGLVTLSQFGIGPLFAFGQFTAGFLAIGQVAVGIYFGLGQLATGLTAIGQLAFGKYVLAQAGLGEYVWSVQVKDPIAIQYFTDCWNSIKGFVGGIL